MKIFQKLLQLIHPCLVGFKEYDHDFKYIDDSFSHEYGTEICGYWECQTCGTVNEDKEPPGACEVFDYEIW
jgi:rubrerythrin